MTDRRRFWARIALVALAVTCLSTIVEPAMSFGQTTEEATANVEATAVPPDWTFVSHRFQDPYLGTITFPTELPPGHRVAAAEVEVVNESSQPLVFTPYVVRLRVADGASYQGGSVFGLEPPLEGRALEGGERTRGWVWFAVPSEAEPVELVLVPQAPEFVISLTGVGIGGATASPTSTATSSPTATTAPTSSPPPRRTVAPTRTPPSRRPATPEPSPTAAAQRFDVGEDVVNTADVNLRVNPSLNADVIAGLPAGTMLTIMGPSEDVEGFVWWPVAVAADLRGYVVDNVLAPLA